MSTSNRLTEVFESAKKISFDDDSKFILFSDCHRGDNSWADDFAHNQNLFFYALQHYYDEGFTYIEIGDGDELWENKSFADIRQAHSHVFWLMGEFHTKERLYLIWGNHDIERQSPSTVKETLYQCKDERTGAQQDLFKGIEVHEGIVLRHTGTGVKVFLVHGHQGDLLNDRWWRLGRFFVRRFWRHLQLLGVRDPTSPAKNFKKRDKVENKIIEWINTNKQILIAGHTHRPRFPGEGEPLYFNDGSCVHPRVITGIEIQNGEIMLIKWSLRPNNAGALTVMRDVLEGPKSIHSFL